MADPITILTIASTAVSAMGAIEQGKAAQQEANARAQANIYNAKVKEMQAGIERQQANAREEQQRRRARQVLGQQRGAIAESGVGFIGSALDIAEESATRAELDALTIRYEGELASKGLLADAEQERYESKVNVMAGKNAMRGAYLSATSALLSGGTKYYGYKETGKIT
jgi:multidrug resistance efflux pump